MTSTSRITATKQSRSSLSKTPKARFSKHYVTQDLFRVKQQPMEQRRPARSVQAKLVVEALRKRRRVIIKLSIWTNWQTAFKSLARTISCKSFKWFMTTKARNHGCETMSSVRKQHSSVPPPHFRILTMLALQKENFTSTSIPSPKVSSRCCGILLPRGLPLRRQHNAQDQSCDQDMVIVLIDNLSRLHVDAISPRVLVAGVDAVPPFSVRQRRQTAAHDCCCVTNLGSSRLGQRLFPTLCTW